MNKIIVYAGLALFILSCKKPAESPSPKGKAGVDITMGNVRSELLSLDRPAEEIASLLIGNIVSTVDDTVYDGDYCAIVFPEVGARDFGSVYFNGRKLLRDKTPDFYNSNDWDYVQVGFKDSLRIHNEGGNAGASYFESKPFNTNLDLSLRFPDMDYEGLADSLVIEYAVSDPAQIDTVQLRFYLNSGTKKEWVIGLSSSSGSVSFTHSQLMSKLGPLGADSLDLVSVEMYCIKEQLKTIQLDGKEEPIYVVKLLGKSSLFVLYSKLGISML